MKDPEYMSMEDVAEGMGVKRSSLYYYVKALGLKKHKFPLDKRVYILVEDFDKLKRLKDAASTRGKRTATGDAA